jgi:MFS family permease
MPKERLFDLLPAWAIFVGTTALVLISIYVGVFLARFWHKRSPPEKDASVSTLVGATTALLAFLLAFTFGLAASRFDAKRGFLLDEVNAIGTAFLRAGLIPEPHRTAVRTLLKEYVDIRVELYQHPEKAEQLIPRSGELQGLMWAHAEALVNADLRNPPIVSLFVSSLNEMFDMQTKRITIGVYYQMPTALWAALFTLTVLSMLEVGYLLGMSDRASWLLVLLLSLALATVILLIVDLDRSGVGGTGLIKVEQQPMRDLQQWISQQMSSGQAQADMSNASRTLRFNIHERPYRPGLSRSDRFSDEGRARRQPPMIQGIGQKGAEFESHMATERRAELLKNRHKAVDRVRGWDR